MRVSPVRVKRKRIADGCRGKGDRSPSPCRQRLLSYRFITYATSLGRLLFWKSHLNSDVTTLVVALEWLLLLLNTGQNCQEKQIRSFYGPPRQIRLIRMWFSRGYVAMIGLPEWESQNISCHENITINKLNAISTQCAPRALRPSLISTGTDCRWRHRLFRRKNKESDHCACDSCMWHEVCLYARKLQMRFLFRFLFTFI